MRMHVSEIHLHLSVIVSGERIGKDDDQYEKKNEGYKSAINRAAATCPFTEEASLPSGSL